MTDEKRFVTEEHEDENQLIQDEVYQEDEGGELSEKQEETQSPRGRGIGGLLRRKREASSEGQGPPRQSFEDKVQPHLSAIFKLCIDEGIFDYDTEEAKLIIKSMDNEDQKKVMKLGRDPKEIIEQIPAIAIENGGLSELPKDKRNKFFDTLDGLADQVDYQMDLIIQLGKVLSHIILEADRKAHTRFMAGIQKRPSLREIFFEIQCEAYEQLDAWQEEATNQEKEKEKESL